VSWFHVRWDDAASRIVRLPQAKLKVRGGTAPRNGSAAASGSAFFRPKEGGGWHG
jgi:hypothetical protein